MPQDHTIETWLIPLMEHNANPTINFVLSLSFQTLQVFFVNVKNWVPLLFSFLERNF